ncbi:protein CHUP1, chloroplastic-like [Musa troglodytarum]|uniref:Protein CHUP1, chloroplastic-like n=1 Tax=Musa troglodytarum TaxID=320322 RepID=A0A9E7KJF3_9LILI|nr:protein CHUP1, chloroplastic-like [Musa troglodytarum]
MFHHWIYEDVRDNHYCCKGLGMKLLLEMEMEDGRPLLPRLGVALAVHLASYVVSLLNFPTSAAAGDESKKGLKCSMAAHKCFGSGLKDGLLFLQNKDALVNIIHGTSTTPSSVTKTAITATTSDDDTEQSARSSRDEEGLPLQAAVFQEAEQESESSCLKKPVSIELENEKAKMDAEIVHLSNLAQALWDRNRSLEMEMLEYYGLKELQEAAVKELENQLKLKSVEAKCLSLKVESLMDENQWLKLQASEFSGTMQELGFARARVKHLKRRQKYIHVQAREKISSLEKRIRLMQAIKRRESRAEAEVQNKLKRVKELEVEAGVLRKENSMLTQENLDLARRLESEESSISTTLERLQAKALEEVNQLREANEKLKNEIEQLQTDRCTDVEELVYLRWLNACLRYEQRDHHPLPGKTIARDLSNSLSPESEDKAKQLILEYACAGLDDTDVSFRDLEADYSSLECNGDGDDTPFDDSFVIKDIIPSRKPKFLGKLKKLVLRKGSKNNKVASVDRTPAINPSNCATPERRSSLDEATGRNSFDSIASCFTEEHSLTGHLEKTDDTLKNKSAWSRAAFRSPFNLPGERRPRLEEEGKSARCKSDLGTSFEYRRRVTGDGYAITIGEDDSCHQGEPETVRITKYAEALMSSRASSEPKQR